MQTGNNMKVIIKDKKVLGDITPLQLINYLHYKGADKIFSYGEKGSIWKYKNIELLVPQISGLRDYPERVAQLIKSFSTIDEQSELQVLENIRNIGFDIIRIRNNSDEVRQGTMNFLHCLDFINYSRDMLLSAACSAATGKISYPGKKPIKAEEYMQNVRFGQTEEGSFILQVLSPVKRELKEQGTLIDLPDNQPYENQIVPMLSKGLHALNEASSQTSQDDDIGHFITNAKNGLTTNLCDAITGIYSAVRPKELNIDIRFSSLRSINIPPTSINIYKDNISLIEYVSDTIKRRYDVLESEQIIRGPIIKLISDDTSEGGEIIVRDFMDVRPRCIRIQLDSNDYHQAVRAHDTNNFIEIEGIIEKKGNILKMAPESDIKIFDPTEETSC